MHAHQVLKQVRSLKKTKQYDRCIALLSPIFENAVNLKAIDPDIVRSLAEVQFLAGNPDEGIQVYSKALKSVSSGAHTLVLGRYSEFLGLIGRSEEGLSLLDDSLEKLPDNQNFALSKGIILHRYLNDLDQAAAFMWDFIEALPLGYADESLESELKAVLYKIEREFLVTSKKGSNCSFG